jgi:hypothetical protein
MVVEAVMRELYSEIVINGTPEQVWGVLTNFSGFPNWNPFVRRASGTVKQGERIEVYLQPPDGPGMTIKPTLTEVVPNRELRWLGHTVIPGLFDGEHIFTIEALEADGVRFIQREVFGGILASPVLRLIGENTLRGFETMNKALKAEAEKSIS